MAVETMAKTTQQRAPEKKAEGGKKARAQDVQEARREARRPSRLRAHPRLVQQHAHHDHRHRGQRDRVVERRRHRLQGIAQGHAVRGDAGGDRTPATPPRRYGLRSVEVRVKGPGSGRESAIRALQTVGHRGEVDPRRHADSAQRLPSDEARASERRDCQMRFRCDLEDY